MSAQMPYHIRPSDVSRDDMHGWKVIAVASVVRIDPITKEKTGFWSAFRGPTDWSDERVAAEGYKISKEAAEELFYAMANSGLTYYDR